MKGRKPKDLALRIIQGNPGRRRLEGTTAFTVGPVEKPLNLDDDASQEWDRLTTALLDILSAADRGMLLVAVDAYSAFMGAARVLKHEGATYQTQSENGSVLIRLRPEVRMRDTARRAYAQALAELGASPVGHSRVHRLPPKPPATPEGISKFFTH